MSLKGKSPEEVSTINVTPLVDVMLVLLIIFMVITPMLQKNVSVDMVKTQHAIDMNGANKTNAVVLSVTRDGKVYLGRDVINVDDVTKKVQDAIEKKLDKTVYLKCDSRAKYGDVTQVVDGIRAAGVEDLGLLTQQTEEARLPQPPPPAASATP
ncbi:MAG: biopolymer transporter ExbD [Acidobacteriota bacterium]|nr:biopolymer transporter ExbD [Acidobacteriota bacterium]